MAFPCARFSLLFLLLAFTTSSSSRDEADGYITTVLPLQGSSAGEDGQKVWCIAKPSAPDYALVKNLDYACGQPGVDCSQVAPGRSCFNPNTVVAHASYAMNMYYQAMGRNSWNCFFNNTGVVTISDPSYGGCTYPSK